MYSLLRAFVVTCLLVSILFAAGCAAPLAMTAGMAAAQAGTGAYVAGELRSGRYATLDEAWQAVHNTVDDLELEILTERISERSRYVMAKEQGGPEFKITAERKSPTATRIRIRVGIIGDVALSRLTMRRIDYHLTAITERSEFDDDR
jgi:hypothetical protein